MTSADDSHTSFYLLAAVTLFEGMLYDTFGGTTGVGVAGRAT